MWPANLTLPLDLPPIELVDNVMVEVLADFGKGKQVVDNGANAVEPKKKRKNEWEIHEVYHNVWASRFCWLEPMWIVDG